MLRALSHYWKINAAVAVAAAINTAVLAGALIVGDSVRGSLRDMTLDRLGAIDLALVAERFFPESIADRLAAADGFDTDYSGAAPAVLLPGSAVHADSGARASQVTVMGIDERFTEMFTQRLDFSRRSGQMFPSVIINETLRRQIDAAVGDAVLLSFSRRDDIPDDTLLGKKDATDPFGTVRATVVGVLPDTGMGRFSLSPHQAYPSNAFMALPDLQRALDQEGLVDAVFVGSDATTPQPVGGGAAAQAPPAQELLRGVVDLRDLGLLTEWHGDALLIESSEYVLRPATVSAIEAAARQIGARDLRVTTYLATAMSVDDRTLPYSTVTALAGAPEELAGLQLVSGAPAPPLDGDQILLDEWAANDLGASLGDTLHMEYYVVGAYESLGIGSHDFTVAGVVAMRGLGADSRLTPKYPGIEDTENIADWDPPFPVDLTRVRNEDEAYWDDYRATPKTFVAEETAAALWGTRYGSVTSIRLIPASPGPGGNDGGAGESRASPPATAVGASGLASAPEGPTAAQQRFANDFAAALLGRVNLQQFGMRFLAVKAEGLDASGGATDFSGLFIGFSFFIIVSAALLVGLLFSLGVEARAGEIGLRLAVGYPVKRVRRQMLAEGGAVAAVGALLGLAAGVGYAGLMMLGLRTLWQPAVGTNALTLHVTALSLAMGWVISMLVVLFSIWFTVRRLGHVPATALLKGSIYGSRRARRGARRWRRIVAMVATVFALLMLGYAVASGTTMDPMVFGTIGFPLLVAGLAAFAEWCRTARGRLGAPGSTAVIAMAARNSAWNPGRSILSVALVALASFVIVTVAANYRDPTAETHGRDSGTGGFALRATSEIPVFYDLNDANSRFDLGISDADEELFARDVAHVYALHTVPGDDASCLNLYQPQKPRLVGASDAFIARGGFAFAATLGPEGAAAAARKPDPASGHAYDPDNPWTLLYQDLGPGVIPAIGDANSVQWILHLGLGADLTVENERGEPVQIRIAGTLSESVFQSELLISDADLLANFPSRSGYSTFLIDLLGDAEKVTNTGGPHDRAIEVTNVGEISQALERALGPYGFDAQPTDEILARFLVVQNTYLSTFQLLGGLGLLLGTLGLGVILVRNVIERRAELATLRAFGYRRALLSRMVLAENAFLLVIGTAVGSLASLIAVAPRFVGGAFSLPWGTLGLILAAVLIAGMLSSIAAVAGALRVPLLPVLKGDR